MDVRNSLVVERLVAQADRVDALKTWLQLVAERTRHIPGVHQVELLQSEQNPAEFVFFLITDDLPVELDPTKCGVETYRGWVHGLRRIPLYGTIAARTELTHSSASWVML